MGKQLDIQKYRIDFMIGIAASVVASLLIATGGWVFDAISNIDIGVRRPAVDNIGAVGALLLRNDGSGQTAGLEVAVTSTVYGTR